MQDWRCCKNRQLKCPPEGCPVMHGCARERGWDADLPVPGEYRDLRPLENLISRAPSGKALRKPLTRTERFAAVILDLKFGNGEPIVDRERAKSMTAEEIVAAFEAKTQDDHIVPVAIAKDIGWSREKINHPANMQIIPTETVHAPKTKRDVTEIAKTKRIEKSHEEFRIKVLAKAGQSDDSPLVKITSGPKSRLGSRPFPKRPEGMKYNWGRRRMKGRGTP